jgi:hypothetical protein
LSSALLCQEDEQTDSASEREGNSMSEREGGSDKETDSTSERDGGFDEETDSLSESADGSDIGASGSDDTNPSPVLPPNDETAFCSTLQFPKDQADLVKLELVNLVLEIVPHFIHFTRLPNGLPEPTLVVTYSSPMTAPIRKLT